MEREEAIAKAVFGTISEISKKEKQKAIENENYAGAIVASFIEGIFKT